MRRPRHLLRDLSRKVYFKGAGEWTPDPDQAQDFPDMRELIAVCEHCGVRDAEVVEHFPGAHFDVHTPLNNSREPGGPQDPFR